jgi:hypothetical protein
MSSDDPFGLDSKTGELGGSGGAEREHNVITDAGAVAEFVRRPTPGPESDLLASSRDRWFFGIHSHPQVELFAGHRAVAKAEVGREARLCELDVSVRCLPNAKCCSTALLHHRAAQSCRAVVVHSVSTEAYGPGLACKAVAAWYPLPVLLAVHGGAGAPRTPPPCLLRLLGIRVHPLPQHPYQSTCGLHSSACLISAVVASLLSLPRMYCTDLERPNLRAHPPTRMPRSHTTYAGA